MSVDPVRLQAAAIFASPELLGDYEIGLTTYAEAVEDELDRLIALRDEGDVKL